MKKYFSALVTLALLFFGAACVPQETNTSETGDKGGKTETSTAPSVTVGADNVSAISVVLKGKANLTNSAASDLQVGFQYSKSAGILPSNSITIEADDSDANYNYSSGVTGLEPETTYYFRSFVQQNGVDSYGETLSFTTKDVSSLLETLDATDVEASTATLNAKLDLTDVLYTNLVYGFSWGDSEQEQNNQISGGEITNKSFSASPTELSHKTQYWYKAYVTLDNKSFYGDVKTITTAIVPVENVSLNKEDYAFHTIGDTFGLEATIIPSDATDKIVSWASDNTAVATVDANGNVTARSNGKAMITVTTNDQSKTSSCAISVAQYVTEITLNKSSLLLHIGDNNSLSVTSILPSNAYDKTCSWVSSDESVAIVHENGNVVGISDGTVQIIATANDGSGVNAVCAVKVIPEAAVDLGLSVFWANSNLSTKGLCANPEECGDYYAWGEIEPYYLSQNPLAWKEGKTGYNWESYSLSSGSASSLTKYNGTIDNRTVLVSKDDAAAVTLGGSWRMPTEEEWTELITNCTWTKESGVNGRKVTGPNGNSIFLPAAGYWDGANLSYAGATCDYWSSSRNRVYPDYALGVLFNSAGAALNGGYRCLGKSVRPVTE